MPTEVLDQDAVIERAHDVESEMESNEGRAGRIANEVNQLADRLVEGVSNNNERQRYEGIAQGFAQRVESLNVDENPPSAEAYDSLPESVRDLIYEQWQTGHVEILNTINDMNASTQEMPEAREAVFHMLSAYANGRISPEAVEDIDNDEFVNAVNQLISHNGRNFNQFVERYNLGDLPEDVSIEQIENFREQETVERETLLRTLNEALDAYRPEEEQVVTAEVQEGPTVEMEEGTVWQHLTQSVEMSNENYNASTEVISAVFPEELRDAKGDIPKDLRPRQHASIIQGYTRRKSDNAVVRAPVLSVSIKQTRLKTEHHEVVTNPRDLRPRHPVIMNRRITNPEDLAHFEYDLANAVIEDVNDKDPSTRRVRFVSTSVDKDMQPVKKLVEVSYEDYSQMMRLTHTARAQYERAGIEVPPPTKKEPGEIDEIGETLVASEYLITRDKISARMDAEIAKLRAEGNDYLADQLEDTKAGMTAMYHEFITNYDSDAYQQYEAQQKLLRRKEDLGEEDLAGIEVGSEEWKKLLEDEVALLKLEYSYKAVIYDKHAKYLDEQIGLMLDSGDSDSVRTMLLNIDYMLEIEAMAYYKADIAEVPDDSDPPTVDDVRNEMHQFIGGFLRSGTDKEAALREYGEAMQENWQESAEIWASLDEALGDEVQHMNLLELEALSILEDKHFLLSRKEAMQLTEGEEHTLDFLQDEFFRLFDRFPDDSEFESALLVVNQQKYIDNIDTLDELNAQVGEVRDFIANEYMSGDRPAAQEVSAARARASNEIYNRVLPILDVNERSRLEATRLDLETQAALGREQRSAEYQESLEADRISRENRRLEQVIEGDPQGKERAAEYQAKVDTYLREREQQRQEHIQAVRAAEARLEAEQQERERLEHIRQENAKLAAEHIKAKDKESEELRAKGAASEALEAAAILEPHEQDALADADYTPIEAETPSVELNLSGDPEQDAQRLLELFDTGEARGFVHDIRPFGGEKERNMRGGITAEGAGWMHYYISEEFPPDFEALEENGSMYIDIISAPRVKEDLSLDGDQVVVLSRFPAKQVPGQAPSEGSATFSAYMVMREQAARTLCDMVGENPTRDMRYAIETLGRALDLTMELDEEGYVVNDGTGQSPFDIQGIVLNR